MNHATSMLDSCDISPIKKSNKHLITPQRTKRKTSRRDQGADVHSSCSTPNSQSPSLRILSSPSSSFPCSQDNHPDVIWDYTSPKLPKGAKKKEIKLTVQELLENLNHCQVPECNSNVQPVQYVKLLENWMTKQKVDGTVKKIQKRKGVKKRPRQVIEELKKFIETIPRLNKSAEKDSNAGSSNTSENKPEVNISNNSSKLNISSKSFLAGDSTDNDSTEELWGDVDNSFIVKATQELDTLNTASTSNPSREDLVSTIPETAPAELHEDKRHSCSNRLTLDEYNDFLEQLTNVDWDSDMEEWDNGFLIGEDELSQIPEDILSGNTAITKTSVSSTETSKIALSAVCTNISESSTEHNKSHTLDEVEVIVPQGSNAELYNSFEDENFEDETLLCQPDILSKIDEVESLLSQQPRCTPEEIKKKKDEAIKRRQKVKAKSNRR